MKPLYEQYRPETWADVVGQGKVVNAILAIKARSGLTGRAYWLSGPSGAGKSSIARLIAQEVADGWDTDELDATGLTPSQVRELESRLCVRGMSEKGGRAVIVNEAHGLSKATIRQLLVTLERIPSHCVWIFSTTSEAQDNLFDEQIDAGPLLSRCLQLPLARRDLAKPFAERARQIAQAEGLDGKPIEAYIRLIQKHRQNLRAALNEIESGAMLG